jgi:glutamate formiminotransferase / 5-formyltetrahydrofolate cyclo-ligase
VRPLALRTHLAVGLPLSIRSHIIGIPARFAVARSDTFDSPNWGTLDEMQNLLEAVPNFSEGRDQAVLAAIREAIEGYARVLDVHADADHNRSVFTCVGEPQGLVDGLAAAVAVALERIDLRSHTGVHPRVGAADVLPIVRFAPDDERPRRAALELAERIGRLGIPVLGYGELGDGRRPAFFRAGGPARLAERLAAGELEPIAGPSELHPSAGAALVGVRAPLVAFNVNLDTDNVELAQEIAALVRASAGGLPGVQALGMLAGGRAQVSMNLIDTAATPLAAVVAEVARLAAEAGAAVHGSELVGLMPAAVAAHASAQALRLPEMPADRLLEIAVAGEFG